MAQIESLEAMWQSYRTKVIPASAPDVQVTETKRAFFAAANAVIGALNRIGEDDISEEQGVSVLGNWYQECVQFLRDVRNGRA